MLNLRSDVDAKKAFVAELESRGFSDVRVVSHPADISAVLDGVNYLFEIKYTRSKDHYFGAATLTEWVAAIEYAERFRFVVAFQGDDAVWRFNEYTAAEFMQYSYVPPFKIFFNVPVGGTKRRGGKMSTRVDLTHERLELMTRLFEALRD